MKLELLYNSGEQVPSTDLFNQNPGHNKPKPYRWTWLEKSEHEEEAMAVTEEKYRWKAFGNLWFEDALMKVDTKLEELKAESEEDNDSIDLEEKNEGTSMDGDDNATLDLSQNAQPSTSPLEDESSEKGDTVNAVIDNSTNPDQLEVDSSIAVEEGDKIEDTTIEDTITCIDKKMKRRANPNLLTVILLILGAVILALGAIALASIASNEAVPKSAIQHMGGVSEATCDNQDV